MKYNTGRKARTLIHMTPGRNEIKKKLIQGLDEQGPGLKVMSIMIAIK